MACSAGKPNSVSAIGLNSTTRCSSSTEMMASIDERMIPASRASFSAIRRSPLSSVPVKASGPIPNSCPDSWSVAGDLLHQPESVFVIMR
jgi:hypothetical protein